MKFFNKKRTTKKELRALICKFAKQAGVNKVIFSATGKRVSGTYHSYTKHMFICLKGTKQNMLRTFFHELAHHVAACQNKWKKYHFNLVSVMRKTEIFKIENRIDRIGEKLWYKNVDLKHWGRYKYFYPKAYMNKFMNSL